MTELYCEFLHKIKQFFIVKPHNFNTFRHKPPNIADLWKPSLDIVEIFLKKFQALYNFFYDPGIQKTF